ncbi:MAG TPA: DNA repair protein RecO [Caldisericia bacterium]|nr:DNA repair protein RecO [Caldisericia bacterium]HPF48795.1 DNA repair protein RecO [Caldisericia bacterium]HPI84281.1 DNA repair protein RecO [Caldisericia bacterium]HPQ93459.1 DNA repair protein RecO [Caldisericia bacterium]HRV74917.1 DNA repair protein RecO [Caldisericia bacterium]
MRHFKTNAIIYATKSFKDHDKFLSLMQEDGRRIDAKIRKARHTNTKWGSLTEPVSVVSLMLYEKSNHYTVTGISLIEHFESIDKDYKKMLACEVIAETINNTTPYGVAEDGNFDIVYDIFSILDNTNDAILTINIFFSKIILAAGYSIDLDYCGVCGSSIDNDCYFDVELGSTLCNNCHTPNRISLPNFARLALKDIIGGKLSTYDKKLMIGINILLERIVEHHFGFRSRCSLHLRE